VRSGKRIYTRSSQKGRGAATSDVRSSVPNYTTHAQTHTGECHAEPRRQGRRLMSASFPLVWARPMCARRGAACSCRHRIKTRPAPALGWLCAQGWSSWNAESKRQLQRNHLLPTARHTQGSTRQHHHPKSAPGSVSQRWPLSVQIGAAMANLRRSHCVPQSHCNRHSPCTQEGGETSEKVT